MTTGGRAIALAAIATIALAACGHGAAKGGRGARPGGSPAPIPTAAAKQTTVTSTVTISGIIAPLQNVAITSSLTEPADAVRVNEGDHVSKGEVLAVLDTADLRAQLAQAQSTVVADQRNAASADAKIAQIRYQARLAIGTGNDQVTAARAALAQAQHTLANDQLNLERDKTLLTNGYIAQQQLDAQQTLVNNDLAAARSAQSALQTSITNQEVNGQGNTGLQAANITSAIADANSAHATVAQAQAVVQQYQTQIDKATIVSPVDGVVVNRNLNPGEYPGGRTLFTVQQLDHVYAELNASSADTFAIPTGANVSMTVAGTGARTYTGKVVAVLGQVAPGSTNFTVKVLVANADGKLQSGLPVTATTSLAPVSGIGIPTTAFLDDTHTSVMIADDQLVDVVAKTVPVKELASNGVTSIVTGLKAGDKVVSNGQLGITDGQSLASN
jgi:RND family efflux transporter MFP subunit